MFYLSSQVSLTKVKATNLRQRGLRFVFIAGYKKAPTRHTQIRNSMLAPVLGNLLWLSCRNFYKIASLNKYPCMEPLSIIKSSIGIILFFNLISCLIFCLLIKINFLVNLSK
jgi:hypothetical protein